MPLLLTKYCKATFIEKLKGFTLTIISLWIMEHTNGNCGTRVGPLMYRSRIATWTTGYTTRLYCGWTFVAWFPSLSHFSSHNLIADATATATSSATTTTTTVTIDDASLRWMWWPPTAGRMMYRWWAFSVAILWMARRMPRRGGRWWGSWQDIRLLLGWVDRRIASSWTVIWRRTHRRNRCGRSSLMISCATVGPEAVC